MSLEGSIPLRPSDLAPVNDWLTELRGRVTRWSDEVRSVSSEEWQRLNATVKSAVSTQRVEQVLKDFLTRIGVKSHSEEILRGLSAELRSQVVAYRHGQTIEHYANFLSKPPRVDL